jgi:integrase
MMNDLRGIMSGIYTKAEEWGYWPEGRRNPISRVKIGQKWNMRPERILTEEETVKVLARLNDPNLLVIETAIATGARISEILGLKWRHVDLENGVIHIVQRNWRGDIDDPKSRTSKRPLTLGYLVDRYRATAKADGAGPDTWVFARTDGSGLPLWDSGVRQALKKAAAAEGCDFPGLGPHSFRRANITWRQAVGGSSIEASKIAGHSTLRMTEEYTKIQLTRQEELTRRIQERLASVGEKQSVEMQ